MGVDMAIMFPTPMLNLAELPAHRGRGRAGPRLQPLALRQHPRQGSAHQVDALSAVQRSRGDLQDGRGVRRPQGRHRLHGDVDALPAELRQRLHEDLCGARRSAACRSASTPPSTWADQSLQLDQPLHRGARPRLHLVQHAAHDQLADQRHAGALPEAEDGVDRERPRLGAVPDAAPRQRVHDAHLGRAAAQAQAERLHARDVLHLAADGDGRQPRGARSSPSR